MKVLLYLTIALCVVSQALAAALYSCSNSPIVSSNCASIINPLFGPNYSHFDLNQLSAFGFNVTLMDAGLTPIFAAISATPLCSQCQTNLQAFFCLNLYPACVTATNVTIGKKPSFPCNDASCTGLSTSCVPSVFTPGTLLFNAAYLSPNYASIPLAFNAISAGFIAQTPLLFSLPSNASIQCANQNAISAAVGFVVNEALLCTAAAVTAAYDTSNITETCPCMPFPSTGTSYCTVAADAFTNIPAIYGAIGVGLIDGGISAGVAAQASLLPVSCASCAKAVNIFACSTGFLQCNSTTNAATAFQFPCESVGANFISACSLQSAYNFATSPYNPLPNATLNAELLGVITSASSLPSSGCAYQPFTPDANCGCVPLNPTDLCQPYISGVSPFLTLTALNAAATGALAQFGAIFGIFTTSPANCSNCIARLTSALCNTIYPACGAATTAASPHCVSSCQTELAGCGSAVQLCSGAFTGLSNNVSICTPYVSTVPALNTATNCPALPVVLIPCGSKANIAVNDSTCNSFVSPSGSIFPLVWLNPVAAAGLANNIDLIVAGAAQGVCSNCQAAINELFCNMAYLSCITTTPTSAVPISLSIPQWGCMTDLNSEFLDCVPPTINTPVGINAFVAGFSAGFALNNVTIASSFNSTGNQFYALFAPLSQIGIEYSCNDFHTENNRTILQTCPCVTVPTATLGGCAPYVTYPVAATFNTPDIATAVLGDPNLVNLIAFSCSDCGTKATEFACLAAFPMCLPAPLPGFIPVNLSVCQNSLITCRALQYTDPEIVALFNLVSLLPSLGGAITAPNVSTILNTCSNFPANGFVPPTYTALPECPCATLPAASQCAPFVSHPVGPFLANLLPAARMALEGAILQFDAGVDYTTCTNCKNAVDFNLCNIVYPICTPTQLAVRGCESNCSSNVLFCADQAGSQTVCETLSSFGALSNLTTCNPFTYTDTQCSTSSTLPPPPSNSKHSGTSSLMPSFFAFILVALFAKILF
jgi:hypothetical protein